MGVSGCGKTALGQDLAGLFGVPFLEGDELHPASNIDKMRAGIPLTDADRWPWLAEIGTRIRDESDRGIVASCSALRAAYRQQLRETSGVPIAFICLHGSRAILASRLAGRSGHFMPSTLLDSQLATLEIPSEQDSSVLDIHTSRADLLAQATTTAISLLLAQARTRA